MCECVLKPSNKPSSTQNTLNHSYKKKWLGGVFDSLTVNYRDVETLLDLTKAGKFISSEHYGVVTLVSCQCIMALHARSTPGLNQVIS